jgi:hypothetical protein
LTLLLVSDAKRQSPSRHRSKVQSPTGKAPRPRSASSPHELVTLGRLPRTLAEANAAAPRLSCERIDIGRDVFRLAARQRHVHPGVRIKNRKRECLRLYFEFARDHVERRGGGDLPARTRRHHMARHAARLGEPLAVVRVGSAACGNGPLYSNAWPRSRQSIQPPQAGHRMKWSDLLLGGSPTGLLRFRPYLRLRF